MRLLKMMGILGLCLFLNTVWADEAVIKKVVEEKFPSEKVRTISKTPYSGLYEVILDRPLPQGPEIVYVSKEATYLFMGNIVDLGTKSNLTLKRRIKLNADANKPFVAKVFSELNNAIKVVRGDGSRQVAVFADPDCPYCRKLEQDMANVTNVTIYTFLYPIAELHPDADKKAKAIWCAPDRPQAWQDWIMRGKLPSNSGKCATPIASIQGMVAKNFGNIGTPTLVFPNGHIESGAIPVEELENRLNGKMAD
jgi:thiol:disulfide interchange protein DsbC